MCCRKVESVKYGASGAVECQDSIGGHNDSLCSILAEENFVWLPVYSESLVESAIGGNGDNLVNSLF